MVRVDGAELLDRLRSPLGDEDLTGLVLVDCRTSGAAPGPTPGPAEVERLAAIPAVIAGHGRPGPGWLPALDVLLDDADTAALSSAFDRNPIAATALALLLRGSE